MKMRIGVGLVVVALTTSLTAAPAAALAPAKKSKGQSLKGTISWATTTTYRDPGNPMSGTAIDETTTEDSRVKVLLKRDPTNAWAYTLKRAKARYDFSMTSRKVSQDRTFGEVMCTDTTEESADGSGRTNVDGHVFGRFNPSKKLKVLDRRTKGISLPLITTGSGTSATTQVGSGTSPCTDGQWSDPIEARHSTTLQDSRWICRPKGLKGVPASELPLLGRWNNKKKRFDFDCSATFSDGYYTTQRLTVSGSLKSRT